jgi:hypothetical protein
MDSDFFVIIITIFFVGYGLGVKSERWLQKQMEQYYDRRTRG